jgi:Leucine-rich repeat (LRR) protein
VGLVETPFTNGMKFEELLEKKTLELSNEELSRWSLVKDKKKKYFRICLRLCRLSKMGALHPRGTASGSRKKEAGRRCAVLDYSVNHIKVIRNLSTLEHLRCLDISVNHLLRIEGLDTLTNLRDLNLSSNNITKIEVSPFAAWSSG